MNDEELIARLRSLDTWAETADVPDLAADRIADLTAERDYTHGTNEVLRSENQRLEAERDALRAKVARLEDALSLVLAWHDKDKYASGKMTFERSGAFGKARAAIAKIKEQQA